MKLILKEIIAVIGTFILWKLFSLGTNAELVIVCFLGLIYMNINYSLNTGKVKA